MKIHIANVKLKEKTLRSRYGKSAKFIDVTSKADPKFLPLSPFYPHGDIPIPFTENHTGMSVEGIWQGLKVFENHDVDLSKLENNTMKNLKRMIRNYGYPKGHRKGINGTEILDYVEARLLIYLPIYKWVLENKCSNVINELRIINQSTEIILLDFTTNDNVFLIKQPLSHAALLRDFLKGKYPNSQKLLEIYKSNPNIIQEEEKKVKLAKVKLKKGIDPNQNTFNF